MQLNILCAGAAQGLVESTEAAFLERTGARIVGHFGAVGAMAARFEAGEPCDVLVTSRAGLQTLPPGTVEAEAARDLGLVRTSVGAREDQAVDVGSAESLEVALRSASRLFVPDPHLSTAGVHVASVLERLEVAVDDRVLFFPNGRTAMRAMAESDDEGALGITQATEIRATPGLRVVGALPPPFELGTIYCAVTPRDAPSAALGAQLVEVLTGEDTAELRRTAGFEATA